MFKNLLKSQAKLASQRMFHKVEFLHYPKPRPQEPFTVNKNVKREWNQEQIQKELEKIKLDPRKDTRTWGGDILLE